MVKSEEKIEVDKGGRKRRQIVGRGEEESREGGGGRGRNKERGS